VTKTPDLPAALATPPGRRSAPVMRFELAELETFLAVIELGSFSLAAKKLHVSQPSVTSRVQRLESTLRVKLLIRNTRHVEATAEGARLYQTASTLLRGLRDLLGEFQDAAEAGRHRVAVATTPMIAATVLPSIIHQYNARYTDVQIELLDLPYGKVIEAIDAGTVHLGVTALDEDDDKFSFRLLAEEELFLIVPDHHPLAAQSVVTLDQIIHYPLMILARYTALRERLALEYRKRGAHFAPMELGSPNTLLGMIDAGNGITFLPQTMVQNSGGRRRVTLRVADIQLARRYGIVTSRRASLSAAAQSFCDFLEREFANTLAANLAPAR
jgi:DNA-binding transcriptional LysR family regulator